MNGLLIIVGGFVFFFSVGGAVMVGGHLLEEQLADQQPAPRLHSPEEEHPIGVAASPAGS
jgi:hypothetical protein